MFKKYITPIFILLLAFMSQGQSIELDQFADLSGHTLDPEKETLRFSNTQKWADEFLSHTRKKTKYLPENWRSKIAAPSAPKNSSLRTQAELGYLLELQKSRTKEDVQRINREIKLVAFKFGDHTYPEITDIKKRPKTAALAKAVNADITIVMFQAKKFFDRVRPSKLDPRIQPSIEIPAHASYPSGHSTQAFMWAYLLFELTPTESHKDILTGAKLIAQDRELAGVHYPSDTALGNRIARQVVDMWMENPQFKQLLKAAKTEW